MHHMVTMKPQKKKIVKFVTKPSVWKFKDEETARLFTHEMAARNYDVTKAERLQTGVWKGMSQSLSEI